MNTLLLARGAFATAVLAAASSTLLFSSRGPFGQQPRQTIVFTAAAYAPWQQSESARQPATWNPPASLRRDGAWTYEVFTPPEIYYDADTRRFSVTPQPAQETVPAVAVGDFGLELLKVERVPFRLQLVGYIGREGNYLGTFENKENSETFLARAGRQVAELGLEIVEFSVRRQRVAALDGASVDEPVAMATVRDLRTGVKTVLNSLERTYTDQVSAVLRDTAEPGREFEAKVGDVISIGATRYTVEKLQIVPPAADVRRETMHATATEYLVLKSPPLIAP